MTDVFHLALGLIESAASRFAEPEGEKDRVVDQISELEFEQMKVKGKVSYLKEQGHKLAVSELERSGVTLPAKIDFGKWL